MLSNEQRLEYALTFLEEQSGLAIIHVLGCLEDLLTVSTQYREELICDEAAMARYDELYTILRPLADLLVETEEVPLLDNARPTRDHLR